MRRGLRGQGMGLSWGDFTSGLSAVLSGGVSLVAPQIEAATGWDLNVNHSPVFRDYVQPAANYVGYAMGYGPAGDYLSGTGQAIAGKVPLPTAWTGGQELPADFLDRVYGPAPKIYVQLPPTPQLGQAFGHGYKSGAWPRYYVRGQA